MSIETEHRGYKIRFNENEDMWTCLELGSSKDMSSPSLAKVKARIDSVLLATRKQNAVPCLILQGGHSGHFTVIDGEITQYIRPLVDRPIYSKARVVTDHMVAVTGQRQGRERISRQEGHLSNHIKPGPEADVAIAEARRLGFIVQKAQADFDAAIKALPRMALEDIEALVKISGVDPTGGLTP